MKTNQMEQSLPVERCFCRLIMGRAPEKLETDVGEKSNLLGSHQMAKKVNLFSFSLPDEIKEIISLENYICKDK
ncbi:hypothetical protein M2145_001656 [Lachnospiraceae bacterium PF1-21]